MDKIPPIGIQQTAKEFKSMGRSPVFKLEVITRDLVHA
jgi:hypothetical protein